MTAFTKQSGLAFVCFALSLTAWAYYSSSETNIGMAHRMVEGISYIDQRYIQSNQTAVNTSIAASDASITTKRKMTSELEFARRRDRVQRACAAHNIPGGTGGIFTHQDSGVLYCFIPKTGCTFWKLFFLAVRNKKAMTLDAIFGISRTQAHSSAGAYGVKYNSTIHDTAHYPHRFMVVRDPFSRLISSYLDKAYLPDHWQSWTMMLARTAKKSPNEPEDFLRKHFDHLASKFVNGFRHGNDTTHGDVTCAKFTTFAQWVKAGLKQEESHYAPLHTQCNPCKLNVTHVNYLHTFDPDARAILGKMSLDTLMDDDRWNHTAQMNQEMILILDYNFQLFAGRKKFLEKCLIPTEMATRLWYNFQWKGFTHPGVEYVPLYSANHTEVKVDLLRQLNAARDEGLKSPQLMKDTKTEFKRRAFLSLGKDTIRDMLEKFKFDFELFDFEKEKKAFFKLIEEV